MKKSPCAECPIHLRGLNKMDPRYPCKKCKDRFDYADSFNNGVGTRSEEANIFPIATEPVGYFEFFYGHSG